MAEYEVHRERIVERPVERVVEAPAGRRTVVERRGGGWGYGFNPLGAVIMAVVAVLLLLLILGVLV